MHILAAIRILNRLECVGETLRQALNSLATLAPDWLRGWVPSAWYDRYGRRFEEYRLPPGKAERYALAEQIGADGSALLTALDGPDAPEWLRHVPAVETLRRVWEQQFVVRAGPPVDQPGAPGAPGTPGAQVDSRQAQAPPRRGRRPGAVRWTTAPARTTARSGSPPSGRPAAVPARGAQ